MMKPNKMQILTLSILTILYGIRLIIDGGQFWWAGIIVLAAGILNLIMTPFYKDMNWWR